MNQSKTKIAGLILAAGTSTRMGRPKQLLPVGCSNLLDHILKEALNSILESLILILGYQAKVIKKCLETDLNNPKLRIIENINYTDGISSSIIAGLSEVKDEYDNVMIILADMPHITSNLINILVHQYLNSSLPLGAIKIENRRSHPVIINRKFYHKLLQLQGDIGARGLFLEYPHQVCLVEPDENYDDTDIDTPEDYLAFR